MTDSHAQRPAAGHVTEACGCPGFLSSRRTTRRTALALGAGAVTAMVGDVLTHTVYAAEPRGNVLVVLSLRGGADGLSLVVPHAEKAYYEARPTTAVAKKRLLHTDATFGLHPALAPLSPLWRQGRLAAAHAVGLPAPNRSHFDAMEQLEDAHPGSDARVGWLNRFVGELRGGSILEGVQLGTNVLPTSLVGPAPTVALESPAAISTPFDGSPLGGDVARGLAQMYAAGRSPVHRAGREALALARAGGRFTEAAEQTPRHGAAYPSTSLGTSMRRAAALVRAGVGVRAIALDHGSWDHHENLGGNLTARTADLAGSLAAFFTDLGSDARRVTVVTLSEFGRRLPENGAAGVDHGYGQAVLLAGAGVRGGRYHSRWPTLREGRLESGDLTVTTDYRHLLIEVLQARFPGVDAHRVFPGAGYRRLGVMH